MLITPFVSVIIPVYNDPIRLKKCLHVLEEQTYPKGSYEIIVVDDGSDESVEPIVAEFNQAKTSLETRSGSFAARNKGLSLARGDIIAFTDSDCIPASDWIEKGVTNLLHVPNCGIVGGKVELFFQDPNYPTIFELYDSMWHLNQEQYIKKINFSASANLFTFKQVFREVGFFDGNVHFVDSDDMEWGQRVASFGYLLIYADDVLVAHPARYSFEQLRQKVIRSVKGTAKVVRNKNHPLFLIISRDFLIGIVPPLIKTIHLRLKYKLGTKKQIEFLLLWCVLRCIEIKERVRVMLCENPQNN